MSYDCPDAIDDIGSKLQALGFSFHTGLADADGAVVPEEEANHACPDLSPAAWACWTGPPGCDWDVEYTETRPEGEPGPVVDALFKYIDHAEDVRINLLDALRVAWDALDYINSEDVGADHGRVTAALDAIESALDAVGLQLPEPEANKAEPIVIDGEAYDYLTAEWRDGKVCVHGWSEYPESSVLAGQPMKRWLDDFGSMEEALAKFPQASPSHPLLQPQVSLAHLPGEDDPVPGGMYPDDI